MYPSLKCIPVNIRGFFMSDQSFSMPNSSCSHLSHVRFNSTLNGMLADGRFGLPIPVWISSRDENYSGASISQDSNSEFLNLHSFFFLNLWRRSRISSIVILQEQQKKLNSHGRIFWRSIPLRAHSLRIIGQHLKSSWLWDMLLFVKGKMQVGRSHSHEMFTFKGFIEVFKSCHVWDF